MDIQRVQPYARVAAKYRRLLHVWYKKAYGRNALPDALSCYQALKVIIGVLNTLHNSDGQRFHEAVATVQSLLPLPGCESILADLYAAQAIRNTQIIAARQEERSSVHEK